VPPCPDLGENAYRYFSIEGSGFFNHIHPLNTLQMHATLRFLLPSHAYLVGK
jgi:hypothetical protein